MADRLFVAVHLINEECHVLWLWAYLFITDLRRLWPPTLQRKMWLIKPCSLYWGIMHITASASCLLLSLVSILCLKTSLFPDYDDQSSHTSVIREHYVFLLETLDVKFSGLVGHLYSKEVLIAVERDDITAEMTSFRANEKLLSALSRKSPQQFQLFLKSLDNCGQRHVRNIITDTPSGLPLLLSSS